MEVIPMGWFILTVTLVGCFLLGYGNGNRR